MDGDVRSASPSEPISSQPAAEAEATDDQTNLPDEHHAGGHP